MVRLCTSVKCNVIMLLHTAYRGSCYDWPLAIAVRYMYNRSTNQMRFSVLTYYKKTFPLFLRLIDIILLPLITRKGGLIFQLYKCPRGVLKPCHFIRCQLFKLQRFGTLFHSQIMSVQFSFVFPTPMSHACTL